MRLAGKLNEITSQMSARDLDLLLVGTSTDLEYLTGLSSMACERFKALAILRDGRHFFVCPELYYEETREVMGEEEPILVWSDSEGYLKALAEADRHYNLRNANIGVNDAIRAVDAIAVQSAVAANLVDGTGVLERLRQTKDRDEIKCLEGAAAIADRVAEAIVAFIGPGMTEAEIAGRIAELFKEHGAPELAFHPIVASGPNSSRPHYSDDRRTIQEQEIIVLDFGCRYRGYCSDISRTVFVGEPTREQEDIYGIVLRANTEAEQCARRGVTAAEVDRAARKVITEAGYGQYFLNRTGHGIGMAVHEAPYIREGNETVLQDGMAFSVEPGIYLPGRFGMRIEDIVLIEDGRGRALNRFSRELLCV